MAELVGLKTAGRLQATAERQKLQRGHRLENIELSDENLEDRQDPSERVLRANGIARPEQVHDPIELVEELFEPQLVYLMDHDEQHLIVLGSFGAWFLQLEQRVDLQIAGVGDC